MKKNLIVFFGEYRTFDSVIKTFKNINEYDVFVVTWSETVLWSSDGLTSTKIKISEELIQKQLPDATVIVSDKEYSFPQEFGISNLKNMLYHWKVAINSIDGSKYEKILFHRTDCVSNCDELFNCNFDDDILYLDTGYNSGLPNINWVGDYFFGGKFDILHKFINSFKIDELDTSKSPHKLIGERVEAHNFKYEDIKTFFKIKATLIKQNSKPCLDRLILENKNVLDEESFTILNECNDTIN